MSTDNNDRQNQSVKRTITIKQKHLQRSRNPLHSFIPSEESLTLKKKAVDGRKGIETITKIKMTTTITTTDSKNE
jgi:hypothetical protein